MQTPQFSHFSAARARRTMTLCLIGTALQVSLHRALESECLSRRAKWDRTSSTLPGPKTQAEFYIAKCAIVARLVAHSLRFHNNQGHRSRGRSASGNLRSVQSVLDDSTRSLAASDILHRLVGTMRVRGHDGKFVSSNLQRECAMQTMPERGGTAQRERCASPAFVPYMHIVNG